MGGSERFEETWSRVGERTLAIFINGDRGLLMYQRFDGDPGFHSVNPRYAGQADAMIDYVLRNGQRDEYPAAWFYPLDILRRALDAFRVDGERPAFIDWVAD